MQSDIISIDNQGVGFQDALAETAKAAKYRDLGEKESMRLEICAEEMLGLIRSVTGELRATYWVESTGRDFQLHVSTKTIMDRDKRYALLSSATSKKNEAAGSFIGRLRDTFEEALTAEADHSVEGVPAELSRDIYFAMDDPEWDRYEQSILRRVADNVKISIRGCQVDMTVAKSFA